MVDKFLILVISILLLGLILYINYKISYKLGIKKALYRTTYILICVVFAFVLAPVINNHLFNLDLSRFDITLSYGDKSFITLIDFIEEVIAHNDFLNDLYAYVPSLKDLFMDFPQLLLVPFTYMLLFFAFLLVFLPLYLYLSYRRKRRILYERKDKKSHRVWAGILGCVQFIFVVSVLLSPLNGISRIYVNATSNTLDDEHSSLCEQHLALKEYSVYCDIIEVYNSTIFATIGGNDSISNYVFDSLTRISYEDEYTSLSKEATLIIKSAIVLNQSGLLNVVNASNETIPLSVILENKLTERDIDIIVDTISNSKYSDNLLKELEILIPNTLNDIMEYIFSENLNLEYYIDKEDLINEIKVVLKALTLISNSDLLNEMAEAREKIAYFVEEFPANQKTVITVFPFLNDLVQDINLPEFEAFCEYLLESKLVNEILPYILDNLFKEIGFNFVAENGDVLDQFYNFIDAAKIIKKYKVDNPFELISGMSDEDLLLLAEIIDYEINAKESTGFIKFLINEIFRDMHGVKYNFSDFTSIKNWSNEVFVIRDICSLAYKYQVSSQISIDDISAILKNKKYENSEFISVLKTFAKQNVSFLIKEIVVGLAK